MSFRRRLTRWKNPRCDFREFPSVIVIRGGLPGNGPTPADVERACTEGAAAGQRFVVVDSGCVRSASISSSVKAVFGADLAQQTADAESFARWLITKFRDRGRVNTFWIGAKKVIP
jgi:hypothetical protein